MDIRSHIPINLQIMFGGYRPGRARARGPERYSAELRERLKEGRESNIPAGVKAIRRQAARDDRIKRQKKAYRIIDMTGISPSRSKYTPHIGKKERARGAARLAKFFDQHGLAAE